MVSTVDAVVPEQQESFSPNERRLLVAVLFIVGAIPILMAVIALLDGWRVAGDNAIIGLHVKGLLRGELPLIGLPSTGENLGSGVESNHPGPFALYVFAPFVAVFGGPVGLALGAAAINSTAWVLSVLAAFRRGGLVLAAATTLGLCLLGRSLGPAFLADPLSSNLGAFPTIAFVMLVWAVLAGNRDLLVWCLVAGTFTVQAHLTYVAGGVGLTAVLVGTLLYQQRKAPLGFTRRDLTISGVVTGVLWLPVVVDQLFGSHNISALIKTATSGESVGNGAGFAFGRLLFAVGVPPIWVQRITGLDFLRKLDTVTTVSAVAILVLLLVVCLMPIRGRLVDPAMRYFVLVLGAFLAASLYSAIKLPEAGTVKASNLRWMWTGSMLVWLGAVGGAVRNTLIVRGTRIIRAIPIAVLALGLLTVSVEAVVRDPRDLSVRPMIDELDAVAADTPVGTYRIIYNGNAALLTVGPAFAFALAERGSIVYVDAGPFTRAYGDSAGFNGQKIDGTFYLSTGDEPMVPSGFEVKLLSEYPEKVGSDKYVNVALAFGEGK
ncbi:MAG: hypothetical protein KDA95_05000 [Acidimicrobiales bacterium]|nr:hypothetical protein [Acidimicrobiales bacterium]